MFWKILCEDSEKISANWTIIIAITSEIIFQVELITSEIENLLTILVFRNSLATPWANFEVLISVIPDNNWFGFCFKFQRITK